MTPRRTLSTALAALLLLSLACSLPGITLPLGRTPTPTPLPPLPPTLAESDPVPGAELDPSGPITLYFDQPMDRASVEAALSIEPFFDTALAWIDDATLELRPAAALPREVEYSLTVADTARSAAGLPLSAPITLRLRTAAPLRVVQVVPQEGTLDVDPGSPLTIVFSRPVVALGAEGDQPAPLTLDPAVEGTGEWLDTGIYVFRPTRPLPGGQRLTATVAAGLQDLTGAPLDQPFSWSFTTAVPRVTEAEPASDGRALPLDVAVRIAFNQAMDRASVERAFAFANASGAQVPGAFAWNEASTEFAFTPSRRLDYDTDYEARLAASASAPSGSSLGTPLVLPYRSAGRPAIVASSPPDGGQKNDWEGVQLTFAGPMDPASLRQAVSVSPAIENLGTYWDAASYTLYVHGDYDPTRDYSLTVAASATDPYGTSLSAPFRLRFSTRDLPAATGFMRYTDVLSLEAGRSPVIQVQARNAGRLDFALYRLSLPQFFELQRDGVYMAAQAPRGELLRQWPVDASGGRNLMQTIDVSLQSEPLPTGVYLLLMTAPSYDALRTEARLILVRDTEIVLKASRDRALTWAVDLGTGRPKPGLAVEIISASGNAIARGTTGEDGAAEIVFTPAEDAYLPVIAVTGAPGERPFGMASTSWAEEIYPWTFGIAYNYDFPGPGSKVYVYTDRPIYRPGQTIHFRGVLRDVDDALYRLPAQSRMEVKLLDAFGIEIGRQDLPVNEYGAFSGSFVLAGGAALGVYSLDTGIGGVPVTVAAYRKPEFEVTVQPSAEDAGVGDALQAVIQGEYYFGGPVADSSVRWTAWALPYHPPDLPQPIDWFAYAEGPNPEFGEMLAEGEGQTDAQGRLEIDLPTTPEGARPLEVTITAVLTDSSGMPVQGEAAVRLHPAGVYFGLEPESYAVASGGSTSVHLSAIDWQGAPVPRQQAALTVERLTWTQVVRDDGTLEWEEQAERVAESSLTMDGSGKADYAFRPARPGSYRLRVEGQDAVGRSAVSTLYLWAYGPEAFSWRSPGANRIALVADRARYEPGDTARILIPSPFDEPVQALVTIERARVLSHRILEVPAGQTTIDVPLDASHLPNVFLSVVLIKPSGASGPAALAMGMIELPVSAESRQLNVTLTPDRPQAGPGEEVTYRVKATDSQGRPVQAEFSLALVDEAVLALAEPNSTDPFTAFYSPLALGVRTGAALTVSGEGGPGTAEAFGRGGGGGDGALEPTVRTRFPDTAYWNARVVTNAQGQADVTLRLPDSLTTWRMDARGVTQDTRLGSASADLTATRLLLIRPVTPRFFTAGDAATVAAVVNNNTPQPIRVEARLEVEGARLTSEEQLTIEVPKLGQTRVEWRLDVGDGEGVALTFYAQGGGLEDASTPTIGSALDGRIPVLHYSAPDTFATSGGLDRPGERLEAISLPRRFDATQGGLTVALEPSLGSAMATALEVLEAFPYDCTEQVVSRFLPNLAALRAAQAVGIDDAELKDRLERAVTDGLTTLRARQQYDGGWAWWSSGPTNPYLTAYALFSLLEARRAGFSVSDYTIEAASSYLEGQIGVIDPLSAPSLRNRQAFVAYVQARAGVADIARLQALAEARAGMSHWARASLALALEQVQPGAPLSATLLSDLQASAIRSATGVHWQDEPADLWNMGAPVRTTAQVLLALVELEPGNAFNADVVRWLLAARARDGAWESTHDTAWALLAITEWAALSGSLDGRYSFGATLNAQPLAAGLPGSETQTSFTPVDRLFADRPNQLLVTRGAGEGALFYTAHLSVYRPVEDVQAVARGMSVSRQYFLYDGACGSLEKPCLPAPSAHAGDAILGRVTVTLPADAYYVVVEDPFPAGMEPIDGSLLTAPTGLPPEMLPQAQTDRVGWRWWFFNHTELRDDRVVLFADHLPAGTYQYTYLLTAALPGEYRVLPTRAWAFYFPEVYGHAAGRVYTIQP